MDFEYPGVYFFVYAWTHDTLFVAVVVKLEMPFTGVVSWNTMHSC